MRIFICFFAVFLCACQTAAPPPQRAPLQDEPILPIWQMKDDDTTLTLLGTVHLLSPELDWQTETFKTAISTADIIYFETNAQSATRADRLAFSRLGNAAPDTPLSALLPAEDTKALRVIADELDLSFHVIDSRAPWFAAILLGRLSLERLGYLSKSGVESVITDLIKDKNIPIRSLESLTVSAALLSALPEATQIELLRQSIADYGHVETDYPDMIEAWLSGDETRIYESAMADMAEELPLLYNALIVERNTNWLPVLEDVMTTETGHILVAVGAGHLVGEASLVNMLKNNGWHVERF